MGTYGNLGNYGSLGVYGSLGAPSAPGELVLSGSLVDGVTSLSVTSSVAGTVTVFRTVTEEVPVRTLDTLSVSEGGTRAGNDYDTPQTVTVTYRARLVPTEGEPIASNEITVGSWDAGADLIAPLYDLTGERIPVLVVDAEEQVYEGVGDPTVVFSQPLPVPTFNVRRAWEGRLRVTTQTPTDGERLLALVTSGHPVGFLPRTPDAFGLRDVEYLSILSASVTPWSVLGQDDAVAFELNVVSIAPPPYLGVAA